MWGSGPKWRIQNLENFGGDYSSLSNYKRGRANHTKCFRMKHPTANEIDFHQMYY